MDGTVVDIVRALGSSSEDDAGYRAMDETDMTLAWLGFCVVMVGLSAFDICFLAPKSSDGEAAMPGNSALWHVFFWFMVGLVFNAAMFWTYGEFVAIVWFNGYILEYLLSLDNVFFFHVVFTSYSTPPSQIYKALFLGILGAVALRLLFYIVGAGVFRMAFFFQVICGLILIYSGFKTAWSDDDDDDPRENACVKCITRCLPFSDSYDESGALFAQVPVRSKSRFADPPEVIGAVSPSAGDGASSTMEAGAAGQGQTTAFRGTMLFFVVVVLQVVDLIFAVDSVTAKIAEHDNTFINFSSSAFAMLCLRSLYFVLIRLLKYFRFLKYGVAMILILIGIKLIVSKWVEIPSIYSLGTICAVFFMSMVFSILFPEEYKEQEDDDVPDAHPHEIKKVLDDDDLPMTEDFEIELT